jgi:hypothetical protein
LKPLKPLPWGLLGRHRCRGGGVAPHGGIEQLNHTFAIRAMNIMVFIARNS